jgi:hypothetical protein
MPNGVMLASTNAVAFKTEDFIKVLEGAVRCAPENSYAPLRPSRRIFR